MSGTEYFVTDANIPILPNLRSIYQPSHACSSLLYLVIHVLKIELVSRYFRTLYTSDLS